MTRITWSKDRAKHAATILGKLGSTAAAAEHLSKLWGCKITPSSMRHALISYELWEKSLSKAQETKAAMESEFDPLPDGAYHMPGGTTWNGQEMDVQKKQEYNRNMGKVSDMLRGTQLGDEPDPHEQKLLSHYISNLAEDEQRFIKRRRARSVSIGVARDLLMQRQFLALAAQQFTGRIEPSGYALKGMTERVGDRILNVHFSDLHIGAKLKAGENPNPFGAKEEARRLAWVALEAAEWKTQYRDTTTLNLYLNGDVIEGQLEHDQDDGEPLAEQELAFTIYLGKVISFLSSAFPFVRVYCQTGNHGRNKLRHEGRATTSKWNSFEWRLYKTQELMASSLKNVQFFIPKAPVCIIPLFDKHLLLTHGDTELKLADPDTKGSSYETELNRINANLTYGAHIDLLAIGHFHKGRVLTFNRAEAMVNGALVPGNGHARTSGYGPTACGQQMWESVRGHALGDYRFIRVGPDQDNNADLDRIVSPFDYGL